MLTTGTPTLMVHVGCGYPSNGFVMVTYAIPDKDLRLNAKER
jgi:hypothetical protein